VVVCLLLADRGRGDTLYVRHEATYTIRYGGTARDVARRLLPHGTAAERWLVTAETVRLNGLPSRYYRLSRGDKLRVPVYVPSRRGAPLRRWHAAVCAGLRHAVSPRLLVAISMHENPSPSRDWYALGCKGRANRGLRPQFNAAARLCRRVIGDAALSPSTADLQRLNRTYAEDGNWWRKVEAIFGGLRP
jgi:hypothetical protein